MAYHLVWLIFLIPLSTAQLIVDLKVDPEHDLNTVSYSGSSVGYLSTDDRDTLGLSDSDLLLAVQNLEGVRPFLVGNCDLPQIRILIHCTPLTITRKITSFKVVKISSEAVTMPLRRFENHRSTAVNLNVGTADLNNTISKTVISGPLLNSGNKVIYNIQFGPYPGNKLTFASYFGYNTNAVTVGIVGGYKGIQYPLESNKSIVSQIEVSKVSITFEIESEVKLSGNVYVLSERTSEKPRAIDINKIWETNYDKKSTTSESLKVSYLTGSQIKVVYEDSGDSKGKEKVVFTSEAPVPVFVNSVAENGIMIDALINSKNTSSITALGFSAGVITELEKKMFQIDDDKLKQAIHKKFGIVPNNIYLHDNYNNSNVTIFSDLGWDEVWTTLEPVKAEILSFKRIRSHINKKTHHNTKSLPAEMKLEKKIPLSNTIVNTWEKQQKVSIGKGIGYNLDFRYGSGFYLKYLGSLGRNLEKRASFDLRVDPLDYKIDPGRSVISSIELQKVVVTMKVNYIVALFGKVANSLTTSSGEHSYWDVDINSLLSIIGLDTVLECSETITAKMFYNPIMIITDAKTHEVIHTIPVSMGLSLEED